MSNEKSERDEFETWWRGYLATPLELFNCTTGEATTEKWKREVKLAASIGWTACEKSQAERVGKAVEILADVRSELSSAPIDKHWCIDELCKAIAALDGGK